MSVDLAALLDSISADVSQVLQRNPPYEDPETTAAADLPDAASETWYRSENVVAVFVDLQGSTNLSVGRHPASTAAIYRAAMKNAVKVLHDFDADFIQIQGDGAFGLFWGDLAIERGMCAAITVTTFSNRHLEPRLEAKWPKAPATGFKVGIAQGSVLVKKIGTPRNPNEQEPIWAGKPINYAAKAAQQAARGEVIVTSSIWAAIKSNDYLTIACDHEADLQDMKAYAGLVWEPTEIEKLNHDEDERSGQVVRSAVWCIVCGPKFVQAVLAGKTTRAGWNVHNTRLYERHDAGASHDELLKYDEERLELLKSEGLLRFE